MGGRKERIHWIKEIEEAYQTISTLSYFTERPEEEKRVEDLSWSGKVWP